ncbi:hypothetical protein CR513_13543, partial [Mucuna pruriens]
MKACRIKGYSCGWRSCRIPLKLMNKDFLRESALLAQAFWRNDGGDSKNEKGKWNNKLKDSSEGPKVSSQNFGDNNYKKNRGHGKFIKKGGDQNKGGEREFDKRKPMHDKNGVTLQITAIAIKENKRRRMKLKWHKVIVMI